MAVTGPDQIGINYLGKTLFSSLFVILFISFGSSQKRWCFFGPNNGFWQFGPNTQNGRKQLGRKWPKPADPKFT